MNEYYIEGECQEINKECDHRSLSVSQGLDSSVSVDKYEPARLPRTEDKILNSV